IYVGKHGMERYHPRGSALDPRAAVFLPAIRRTLPVLEQVLAASGLDGLRMEDKGITLAIHYRLAPDVRHTHHALRRLIEPVAAREGLEVIEGRKVIEVRPPVDVNKGTALASLAREHQLAAVVFLGDDITDLDAMHELQRLRNQEGIAALNIGVASNEGPAALHKVADVMLAGVDDVIALLAALADKLESESLVDCACDRVHRQV
ncbi:MAG TPA: trehalose-phosphatase, partial [Herpetosiphonaceae bacterium]|nr:trehalose-phosphatase [Herpetosiphonaceae bacterium]